MKTLLQRILLAIVLSTIITSLGKAQTPFQRVYSHYLIFTAVQQTTDGGNILVGRTSATANFVLKLNANANTMWSKTLTTTDALQLKCVQQTSDGGFIAAGTLTNATTLKSRIYMARLNNIGDTLWTKTYGGTMVDAANSVKQTTDGGFIVGGSTNSYGSGITSVYVIKTDSDGNISWAKTYGSPVTNSTQFCNDIQKTSDGGYILTGTSGYTTTKEILVIKLNAAGDTLWTRGFYQVTGGITPTSPIGKSIIQTTDGGYLVLGTSEQGSFFSQASIIKLNSSGNPTWNNAFVFTNISGSTNLNSICLAPGSGYLIAGSATQSMTAYAMVIKTDINGNLVWSQKYGANSYIYGVSPTNDGGCVLAGNTNSYGGGAYLIKTDSLGIAACEGGIPTFSSQTCATTIYKGATVGSGGLAFQTTTTLGTLDTLRKNPCLALPPICLVTVDSALQKNRVIWEKTFNTSSVASYNIYKESTLSGVYTMIGNVSNSNLSTFVDLASNPAQKADRYEITTVDSYGLEACTKSAPHKTIHLNINLGIPPQKNLIWETYEGFTVGTFRIWRGNGGAMHLIDSVQGTLTSYTDLNPPATDTIYYIEALHTPCNPTAKGAYISTKSNIQIISTSIGIDEMSNSDKISIYPSPASNILTIDGLLTSTIATVYDISGKTLLTKTLSSHQIDISSLAKGLYFIKLATSEGSVVRKFVKE